MCNPIAPPRALPPAPTPAAAEVALSTRLAHPLQPFAQQPPDSEQAARMAGRGVPQTVIGITTGMYRAARAGEFAAVDPTLAKLIGRAPLSLREVLDSARSAG